MPDKTNNDVKPFKPHYTDTFSCSEPIRQTVRKLLASKNFFEREILSRVTAFTLISFAIFDIVWNASAMVGKTLICALFKHTIGEIPFPCCGKLKDKMDVSFTSAGFHAWKVGAYVIELGVFPVATPLNAKWALFVDQKIMPHFFTAQKIEKVAQKAIEEKPQSVESKKPKTITQPRADKKDEKLPVPSTPPRETKPAPLADKDVKKIDPIVPPVAEETTTPPPPPPPPPKLGQKIPPKPPAPPTPKVPPDVKKKVATPTGSTLSISDALAKSSLFQNAADTAESGGESKIVFEKTITDSTAIFNTAIKPKEPPVTEAEAEDGSSSDDDTWDEVEKEHAAAEAKKFAQFQQEVQKQKDEEEKKAAEKKAAFQNSLPDISDFTDLSGSSTPNDGSYNWSNSSTFTQKLAKMAQGTQDTIAIPTKNKSPKGKVFDLFS